MLSESVCLSRTRLRPGVLGEVDGPSRNDGEGQQVRDTVHGDVGDL